MPNYLVTWEIDMDEVDSPQEAARKALEIHRNPGSIATVFAVTDKETGTITEVDLDPEDDDCGKCGARHMTPYKSEDV